MNKHAIPDIELRTRLAEKGLECSLLVSDGSAPSIFAEGLCKELHGLLKSAYGRDVTPEHLQYETWAVVIGPSTGPYVACATLSFTRSVSSYFTARFEAVHPKVQKTGVGRLLFDCLAVWARFLVFSDVLVQDGVAGTGGSYFLVSLIDADAAEDMDEEDSFWGTEDDNVYGHGTFLSKLGFIRAQHHFGQTVGEIAFQREFRVPFGQPAEEPAV